MKKIIPSAVLTTLLLAMGVMATGPVGEFGVSVGNIGPGNYGPSVYLAYRLLDIGMDVDGSGSTINPTDIRPGFYAFAGEKIMYWVLVRDTNGESDINTVKWIKDGEDEQGPCIQVSVVGSGSNARFDANGETVYINDATNLQWDSQTDRIYYCELTVETSWTDEDPLIQVQAMDNEGDTGETFGEEWIFNPPLVVTVDTSDGNPITFGERLEDQNVPGVTSPNCIIDVGENQAFRDCSKYDTNGQPEKACDVSFSENNIVITNLGIVNLWTYIASENFYDSTGMAKCPFTNELPANQILYRAYSGSFDSGWKIMPRYSPNLGCSYGQCKGGCKIPTQSPIDVLTQGQSIQMQLEIVWPTPCIGTFDTGEIKAIVRAV